MKVVGPIEAGEFEAVDFSALVTQELNSRTNTIIEAVDEIYAEPEAFDRFVDRFDTFLLSLSLCAELRVFL